MRGLDAMVEFTLRGGQVPIFARIGHSSVCSPGMHVVRRGTGFKALEPLQLALRSQFNSFRGGVALDIKLRDDSNTQFISQDFLRHIRLLRIESYRFFVDERELPQYRVFLPHCEGAALAGAALQHADRPGGNTQAVPLARRHEMPRTTPELEIHAAICSGRLLHLQEAPRVISIIY